MGTARNAVTGPRWLPRPPWILAGAGALLLVTLVFRVNLNWDEFRYLSEVYAAQRGTLSDTWQSFHVHLFGWLVRLPGNETHQVFAGRLVALAAEVVGTACLYGIARRFLERRHAAFAVASLFSSAFILRHGFSFRPDPLCVALFALAVYLVLDEGRRAGLVGAGAGLLLAPAVLLSLKSVILVAIVLGCLGLQLLEGRRRAAAVRGGWFVVSLILAVSILGGFHRWSIGRAAGEPATGLGTIVETQFGTGMLLPGRQYLLASLKESPLLWIAVFGGLLGLAVRLVRRDGLRTPEAVLLPFAIPLATLVVYRNAFPYYYVFVLAPAAVFAGLFLRDLERWLRARSVSVARMVVTLLWLGTLLTVGTHLLATARDRTVAQRQLIEVVHQLFPEPVPYVDRCAMISSYPKAGFFMSTWGMRAYWSLGRPIMEDILRREQPVFLLANSPGLELRMPESLARRDPYQLRPEDRETLRSNFVHHWGLLFVLGKTLVLQGSAAPFEILVEGLYTLEGERDVQIDGLPVAPGESLRLATGPHTIQGGSVPGEQVVLRWGERLPRPAEPPVAQPLFTGL